MKVHHGWIAALCFPLMTGCTLVGPETLRAGRTDYNLAIQQTNDQELLLNLVRLRYRDNLYFLNVERVASSIEINRSMAATAALPERGNKTLTLGAASVGFNEKPSVFYVPLEGEKFVRQMMTPFNPNLLVLLANSGWSIERVFMVMLREMNGVKNAPSASGPTPARAPEFEAFREAAHQLRELQAAGGLELGRIPDDEAALELRFSPEFVGSPAAVRLREILGLHPGLDRYPVRLGIGKIDDRTLTVLPRSMVSSLSFLSQGVMVPEADLAQGRVTRTLDAAGQPFDWGRVFDHVLRIRVAEDLPGTAGASVRYRGHWFYLDDTDLESKSTFSMLSQVFALQAGSQAGSGNLNLSFPIGH